MIWPNWKAAAIVASGPSTRKDEVELLKGRLPVLAIKRNVELAPWADVVYGCDYPWWRSVRGLPEYQGLKLAYDRRAVEQFGCHAVEIPDHAKSDQLLLGNTGVVGGGGNSGFQALNLAVQFGARKILLIGFDCQGRSGAHWYGRNNAPGMNNPSDSNFARWLRAFGNAAQQLKDRDVVNASPLSDIKGFRLGSVRETLERWGLM